MSKPSASTPPKESNSWLTLFLVGFVGFLLGGTIMYFALRRPPAPAPLAAAAGSDPSSHLPDPSLTAGLPPAQAARTLGNFYYDHQNWPQAVQHYESAIRQGSDDADIRTDLGNAYRFSGRPDDALTQYNLAQKMNPSHEFSLFNQGGLFYEDFKQPARAVEAWQEYLKRFPNGQNVAAARALIAQAMGGSAELGMPPAAVPAAPGAEQNAAAESLILRQIKTKDAKP